MTTCQSELAQFQKDTEYYESHQEELRRAYSEQWIAIWHERVVGVAPHLDELLSDLDSRSIPAGQVVIEQLVESDDMLILPA